jgi:peptide/nickel transport system permease protein
MGRAGYILRRLVKGVIVVLAIIVLNFFLIRAAPGDPAIALAGEAGAADAEYLAKLRQDFGLDRPLPEQLAIYMWGFVTLDLGYSYKHGQPVIKLIGERLPSTILLTITAYFLSLALGVMFGTVAALRVNSWVDTAFTVLALVFYAVPLFWLALMSILLFSVVLDWLPAVGYATVGAGHTGFAHVLDVAHHMVLPTIALSLFYLAVYARLARASVLEVSRQEFVTTARAKGVDEGRIVRAHILRNAILPVLSMAGVQAGHLVGGTVIVETIFAWPGIGRLAFEAALGRDYTLLLGVFFLTSALVVVFNLLTDLIYTVVDPRIEVAS